MKEREACERTMSKLYGHYVRSIGALPDAKTARKMEERVKAAAERVEAKKKAAAKR